MFAVVANGIQTICRTQRQLGAIIAFYPKPQFQKCRTVEEAREWIRLHSRTARSVDHTQYGNTARNGYLQVEYFITSESTYYNINTEMVGYLQLNGDIDKEAVIETRSNLITVQITGTCLDDTKIQHHIIAIRRILRIIGEYVDVDFIIPDMSVFLALTKYSGKDYVIQSARRDFARRLGGSSFTVKGKYDALTVPCINYDDMVSDEEEGCEICLGYRSQ